MTQVIVIKNGKNAEKKQRYAVEVKVNENVKIGVHASLSARSANALKRNLDRVFQEISRQ
jgi:hypothetical protein